MAQQDHSQGKHRDIPQAPTINLNSSVAGGAGTDYEHVIFYTPDLSKGSSAQTVGDLPINAQNVRYAYVIFEGTVTGAATNNFTLNFLQRRGGNLLVNTTSATTIVAGVQTVTPAAMTNIMVGSQLVFTAGTGATETVSVSAVTPTTFTATFANGHSGAYTIQSAPLATVTYANGTNAAAFVAQQFTVPMGKANAILAGDVVTLQRISNGTGLAHPSLTVGLDLVPSGVYN